MIEWDSSLLLTIHKMHISLTLQIRSVHYMITDIHMHILDLELCQGWKVSRDNSEAPQNSQLETINNIPLLSLSLSLSWSVWLGLCLCLRRWFYIFALFISFWPEATCFLSQYVWILNMNSQIWEIWDDLCHAVSADFMKLNISQTELKPEGGTLYQLTFYSDSTITAQATISNVYTKCSGLGANFYW